MAYRINFTSNELIHVSVSTNKSNTEDSMIGITVLDKLLSSHASIYVTADQAVEIATNLLNAVKELKK